jgi:hypothetical protein
MKLSRKFPLLCAIGFLSIASAKAQLQTFDTRPNYLGSTFTFTAGQSQGEVFNQVYSVASLTYNFFAGSGGGGITPGDTLSAKFGQWDGSAFVAGTVVDFGTFLVPASSNPSWITIPGANSGNYPTFQATFDLTGTSTNNVLNSTLIDMVSSDVLLDDTFGYVTTYGTNYALMLTATSGNNLALGLTNTNAFGGGATNYGFNDWVFANISVSTAPVPVPESSTIAALIAAAFVAGLVALRLRQRRQLVAVPVSAAA